MIGTPDQVVPLKRELSDKDALVYFEDDNGVKSQRLGFLVDRKTSIVLSATWLVKEGEPLSDKDFALSRFKYAQFVSKEVGAVSKDYYSDDLIYSDHREGISFQVDGARKHVQSISFGLPTRSIAEN